MPSTSGAPEPTVPTDAATALHPELSATELVTASRVFDLLTREAHLRLILDQFPVFTWSTDASLRVSSASGGRPGRPHPVAQSRGETLAEVFGQTGAEHPALLGHVRALAGESVSLRVEWGSRVFNVRVLPLLDAGGVVVGSAAVAIDGTEQARIEEHLRETGQREALGRVAGGVAHEMNNVLTAILGISSSQQEAPAVDGTVRAHFGDISAAARRGGETVANLLGFAGKGLYRREAIQLETLVRDVLRQVRWQAAPGVTVRFEIASGTPDVVGDRAQLETALQNVCTNGLDAMETEGELLVRVVSEEVAPAADDQGGLAPGGYVRIEIIDSGTGMSEGVLERAVEPFFSTKPLGQGIGLGLSMAFGVVRNHKGSLSLVSTEGGGTSVTIQLPAAVAEAPSDVPGPTRSKREAAPRRGTVLVVDDDLWARGACRALLTHLGYAVVEAADGPTALELYEKRTGDFSFVMLDMRMPIMDGDEVLRRLVALDPGVRVILCTGYDRDQINPALFALGDVGFLGKPFGVQEITAEIGRGGDGVD